MRFALLGDHPDGLDLGRALQHSGRHSVVTYCGAPVGAEYLRKAGIAAAVVHDLEEVLADPQVEAVVVAGRPAERAHQLRRALQSERHVLCVHPADPKPDLAYEAALLQGDTKKTLLPLLREALHPAVGRLASWCRDKDGPLGEVRLVTWQRWTRGAALLDTEFPEVQPVLPGWGVLRALGGEVAEVSAFAAAEEVSATGPLLVGGRFEGGVLFEMTFLPYQPATRWHLEAVGTGGRAELTFPGGERGPARLTRWDADGTAHEEAWEPWDPWPAVVEAFEAPEAGRLSWQDAVRAAELDDAARRSVERRRASLLEYPDATEEAGFKGTMTLVGCGLLWALLGLLIVANWFPWLFWLIAPALLFFLGLQLLRWAVPGKSEKTDVRNP